MNPRLTHKIPLLWVVLLVVGISGSSYAGYRYFHKPAPPPVDRFPGCGNSRARSMDDDPEDPELDSARKNANLPRYAITIDPYPDAYERQGYGTDPSRKTHDEPEKVLKYYENQLARQKWVEVEYDHNKKEKFPLMIEIYTKGPAPGINSHSRLYLCSDGKGGTDISITQW